MKAILILHNTFGTPGDALYESRAGVMDQVKAVEAACDELEIRYETRAIASLEELRALLHKCQETIIFNLIEEFLGDVRQAALVPEVCNSFSKSCTGNDTPTLLLAQNKIQAKAMLAGLGLPVPDGTAVMPGDEWDAAKLSAGAYIVKPAFCDASEGITSESVVRLPEESKRVRELVASLHREFNQPVIIERYIPSRELNVSIIEYNGRTEVMPPAEIDFSAFAERQPKIVDYSAKWDVGSFGFHNTPRKIPPDLPAEITARIVELTRAAWDALRCRDYARVDFRLDERLRPYILEVNPNPDISPDAGFAAALTAGDISYERFVSAMVKNAEHRSGSR